MKQLLLLGGSLLLASPAYAQLGLRVGGNFLNLTVDSLFLTHRLGYQVGVFYQVPLRGQLSLVPELQYSREVVDLADHNPFAPTNFRLRFSFLNAPVLVRLTLKRLYVEAGPQVSLLVGGRGEGSQVVGNQAVATFNQALTERYQRFDAGPCVGVGVQLPANLSLSLRAYQGLGNFLREPYPLVNEALPYMGSTRQRRQTLQASLTYQLAAR